MLSGEKRKALVLLSVLLTQAIYCRTGLAEKQTGKTSEDIVQNPETREIDYKQTPARNNLPDYLQEAVLPDKIVQPKEEVQYPPSKRKLPKGMKQETIIQLLQQNAGQLAVVEDNLYTTAQAVPFTFTGLTRKESVLAMLRALDQVKGRGTFFATDKEIRNYPDTIQAIKDAGQEIGICFYPLKGETVSDITADILRTKEALRNNFQLESNLVKQSSGQVMPETREAAAATGCRLIGARVNVVQSRHKSYTSPEKILSEIYGPGVKSANRGGIIQIRLDWYDDPEMAAKVFLYLKRKKIDNIAYNGYGDVSGVNPDNDSAYKIVSVGDILADKSHLWQYPVPQKEWLPQLKMHPLISPEATHTQLVDELQKRYIGEPSTRDRQSLGFFARDFEKLDTTACVKTEDPVIFFGFDDWGDDDSVNHILYVLRKHHVPGNFFILTHNMIYNPNLLRAIALEGHDIGSHTNLHKPMTVQNQQHRKRALESYEEYYRDVQTSYQRLEQVVGDLQRANGRPVLNKFLRPPTLTISEDGVRAILANGFEYIISGFGIDDYAAPDLATEIKRMRDAMYKQGKVRNGAVFVIHMTSTAKYTPIALDVLLTENEKKPDGDPTKFKVGLLSDYLRDGYSQAKSKEQLQKEKNSIKWW